jgi:hypothetical protein
MGRHRDQGLGIGQRAIPGGGGRVGLDGLQQQRVQEQLPRVGLLALASVEPAQAPVELMAQAFLLAAGGPKT